MSDADPILPALLREDIDQFTPRAMRLYYAGSTLGCLRSNRERDVIDDENDASYFFILDLEPMFWRGYVDAGGGFVGVVPNQSYKDPVFKIKGRPSMLRRFIRLIEGRYPNIDSAQKLSSQLEEGELKLRGQFAKAVVHYLYEEVGPVWAANEAALSEIRGWKPQKWDLALRDYGGKWPSYPTPYSEEEIEQRRRVRQPFTPTLKNSAETTQDESQSLVSLTDDVWRVTGTGPTPYDALIDLVRHRDAEIKASDQI